MNEPVLLIAFNRPDLLEGLISLLRDVRPACHYKLAPTAKFAREAVGLPGETAEERKSDDVRISLKFDGLHLLVDHPNFVDWGREGC